MEDLRDVLGRGTEPHQMDLLVSLCPGPGLGEVNAECQTGRIHDCRPRRHVVVLAKMVPLQKVHTSPEGGGDDIADPYISC